MLLRRFLMTALTALGLLAAGQPAVSAATPHYYVSLGDSLSQGYQPGLGDTNEGYPDQLFATLKAGDPALELVKLGCSGETSTSMMKGGRCTYDGASSQLAAAETFLRAHRGQVRYLTIDIGANDVQRCLVGGAINASCILEGAGAITTNLPQITARLRLAAGTGVGFAAMNYYDPFLASWLKGTDGHTLAVESALLTNVINSLEASVYLVAGFRVADVSAAFATNDFATQATLPSVGQVPLNVARICTWTYMCAKGDIHANPTGYQRIAATFATTLARR
ncbi:SGNH/GDSL hydrolase family protein [Actinomadura scrupuli]|uniref:SGNH/GDSL hydrolase family protein n=1 Tax=Actinomadura scrupuli TaxID=559629 RepID=UPI003D96B573